MKHKYVSLASVIEKIYRDYNFSDDLDWVDAIEWAAEAINLIGVPKMYYPKICCLEIDNNRADLPDDLHQIMQVRESTQGYAMKYASDTFHPVIDESLCVATPDTDVFSDFQTLEDVYNNGEALVYTTFLEDSFLEDFTYTVNSNYIFTSFKTGKVDVAYKAFPIDCDGVPEIPDVERVIQAVKSYIAEKIGMKLWMQGKLPQAVYNKLEQERAWYMASGTNAMHLPSIDEMESLKNDWLRQIPKIAPHKTFFSDLQRAERRRTHNSYTSRGNTTGRIK